MQMIFQDPMACLNPRKKISQIIAEGLEIHHICSSKEEVEQKVADILDKVGLSKEQGTRFPHQFSGGQRQRLAMLRLFMKEYPILILDEPTNHLDRETANTVIENIFALSSTKIIITHDESILERVDRVYELSDKKLKQREIFSKSKLQTLGKG